jgi:hypothetical protein
MRVVHFLAALVSAVGGAGSDSNEVCPAGQERCTLAVMFEREMECELNACISPTELAMAADSGRGGGSGSQSSNSADDVVFAKECPKGQELCTMALTFARSESCGKLNECFGEVPTPIPSAVTAVVKLSELGDYELNVGFNCRGKGGASSFELTNLERCTGDPMVCKDDCLRLCDALGARCTGIGYNALRGRCEQWNVQLDEPTPSAQAYHCHIKKSTRIVVTNSPTSGPTVDPVCGLGETVLMGACAREPPTRCSCRPQTDGVEFVPTTTCDGCRGFGDELESQLLKCVVGLNSEATCCQELKEQMSDACAGTVREDNLFMISYLKKCNVKVPTCQVLRVKPDIVKNECDWCFYYDMPNPPTVACADALAGDTSRECCESLLSMKADPCLLARVSGIDNTPDNPNNAGFLAFDSLFSQQCGLTYSEVCPKELQCGVACSDGAFTTDECEDAGHTIIPKAMGSTDGLCLAEGRWVGNCTSSTYFAGANETSEDAITELVVDSVGRSARFSLLDCKSGEPIFVLELNKAEMTKAPSYKQMVPSATVYSFAYELGAFLVTERALDLLTPAGKDRACTVGSALTDIADGCGGFGNVLLAGRVVCPVRFVNVLFSDDTLFFSLGALFESDDPRTGCNKYNTPPVSDSAATSSHLQLVSRQLEYTRSPSASPTLRPPTQAPSKFLAGGIAGSLTYDDKDQDSPAATFVLVAPLAFLAPGALALFFTT